MIVVDTNVVAYLFIDGTYTAEARRCFLQDPQWCVPQLWRSEFRSILSLYLCKNQLSVDEAANMAREAEALMEGREYVVSSEAVLDLVSDSVCSAYDCEFVALARHLGVSLVTADKQLLRAFAADTVSLAGFAGKPRQKRS